MAQLEHPNQNKLGSPAGIRLANYHHKNDETAGSMIAAFAFTSIKSLSLSQFRSVSEETKQERKKKMPCLYISTNVCLDGVDIEPIFSQATRAVSQIIGKPEHFVMVIIKGSVAISFNGNKEPAAYAEIVSMGGINREVKRNLIATIGSILQAQLSIPKTRFFLKVFDTTAGTTNSNSNSNFNVISKL